MQTVQHQNPVVSKSDALKKIGLQTGKENTSNEANKTNQTIMQKQKSKSSRDVTTFKNNQHLEQKRPPSQSKIPSPRPNDTALMKASQQNKRMTLTMNNIGQIRQSNNMSDEPVDLMIATLNNVSEKEQESKYRSTRHQNSKVNQNKNHLIDSKGATITGKRVVQPKLVFYNEDQFTESPSRMNRNFHSKGSKKSKSQTISATLNVKAITGRRQANHPRFIDFLDTNIISHVKGIEQKQEVTAQQKQRDVSQSQQIVHDEKDLTLKILNQSADNVHKYMNKHALKNINQRQHNSQDRAKVQMKYLDFHRNKTVLGKRTTVDAISRTDRQDQANKRSATTMLVNRERQQALNNPRIKTLNKTQSTSADRIHSRLTGGSLSPKQNKSRKEAFTKSAADIPAGISSVLLGRVFNNESELSLNPTLNKYQNKSVIQGETNTSQLQLLPSNKHKSSQPDVSGKKRSNSPERNLKIDKMIRDNIRKELQVQESRRREIKEREASSKHRKNMLELKNQYIRKLNHEKIQRRRLKLKENITMFGDQRDVSETKLLEEALLAVSDGVQRHKIAEKNNNFDSRFSNKDSSGDRGANNRNPQVKKRNALKSKIRYFLQELHPQPIQNSVQNKSGTKTQGMDFIAVRKEIQNELKAAEMRGLSKHSKNSLVSVEKNQWIDSTLNLQTSKSQNQQFVPLRTHGQKIHKISLSLNNNQLQEQADSKLGKKGNTILNQVKNQNMLGKREKIRKFMKDKARNIQSKADQLKVAELNSLKKVKYNLTKLNNFLQRKQGTGTAGTSGITTPALKVKRQGKKSTITGEDDYQPQKGKYIGLRNHQGNNQELRNITPQRTGGLFEHSDVSLNISAKNNGGHNRSLFGQQTQKDLQRLHDTLYEDSRLSSIDTHEERSNKRNGQIQKVLSVCFEKSASQKALRKDLRQSTSPQIIKQRTSSGGKQKQTRPHSALAMNMKPKRKIKSAPPKRQKQSGQKRFPLPAEGKLRVVRRQNNQINTEEDEQCDEIALKFKLSDQAAAIIIQKEVRKYLANLGFYEARKLQDDEDDDVEQSPRLSSPDRNQINLYIKPRSQSSKKRSYSRQHSSSPFKSSSRGSSSKERVKKSSSRGGKQTNSAKRSKESADYELIDPKSSQKSSLNLNISPQKLRKIKGRGEEQKTKQLTLIASEGHLTNSSVSKEQLERLSTEKKKSRKQTEESKKSLLAQSSNFPNTNPQKQHNVPPIWNIQHYKSPSSQGENGPPNQNQTGVDVVSQTSSIFDRNSFQQFSQQNLANILKNNEHQKLQQVREEFLMIREKNEKKLINKLLRENQMTPRTYQQRQYNIERWVSLQRQEIDKSKLSFKEEWEKTVKMIEDTQRNVDFMKSKMHFNGDSNSYSQASSRQNGNSSKPSKSFLIDDAPKSYRSGHNDFNNEIIDLIGSSRGIGQQKSQNITDPSNIDLIPQQIGLQNQQKSRGDQLNKNSRSEGKSLLKDGQEKVGGNYVKPQSMTSEKDKIQESIGNSHNRSSSGDILEQLEDQPSAEFIQRLEKAAQLLLPRGSPIEGGTLNIQEHSFVDDILDSNVHDSDHKDEIAEDQANDKFEDGAFKNRRLQMKDLNSMFPKDQIRGDGKNENEDGSDSDHKSEPMLLDSGDHSARDQNNVNDLRIAELIKKSAKANNNKIEEASNEIERPIILPPAEQINDLTLINQQTEKITQELIDQILIECLVLPKRSKKSGVKSPPPLVEQDNIIAVEQYSIDKEEKKEWIEMRQRHVIEGNLIRADAYVNELVDVLLQFDISDISENSEFDYEVKPNDNFHIKFLKLLTQPIQRPPLNTLEMMQKSELGSYTHFETSLDWSKHPIVSIDLYLEIEKAREDSMRARKKNADARTQQIWESIHIYNKCIFDSVNESLMKFRPYGIVGQPMPWSTKVRRLQTKVEISSVDTERLFQMVKQEIFRWSQVLCGCLPGAVFYFPNPRSGKDEFQEDLFQEVRERRLSQILSQDTVEQEHHWLNYEFEESQVKVDLSDMILESLVGELIEFLKEQQQ